MEITKASASEEKNESSMEHGEPSLQHPSAALSLTIVANHEQRGNPMLTFLKELRVEFANIVPDYLLSPTNALIFISLKFHRLHQEYLSTRLKLLKRHYRVRLLLCLIDLPDYESALENVTYLAFQSAVTLIPAWNPSEAAGIVEVFKRIDDKPPDTICSRLGTDFEQRAVDVLTTIPSVSKVDCASLLREFGTFRKLLQAKKEDIAQIPGIGKRKLGQICRGVYSPLNEK